MAEELAAWEVYELWSEDEAYVYVGSAWKKPAAHRFKLHLQGRGGAPALRDAMQSGIVFSQRVLMTGFGVQQDALDAEQTALDRVLELTTVKVLNLNIYPASQGYAKSPAVREKMQSSAQKNWSDPSFREEALAALERGKATDEAKSNRSAGQKSRVRTEEELARLRTLTLGKKHTDEASERHADAAREVWSRPGEREKRGAARKRAWDEWRARRALENDSSTESEN